MHNDTLFRFNCRVEGVHLAYLLDGTRNAAGIIREAIDDKIEASDYEYDELQQAVETITATHDDPRSVISDANSTDEIIEIATEITEQRQTEADSVGVGS